MLISLDEHHIDIDIEIPSYFNIVRNYNCGVAIGIGQVVSKTSRIRCVLMLLSYQCDNIQVNR